MKGLLLLFVNVNNLIKFPFLIGYRYHISEDEKR